MADEHEHEFNTPVDVFEADGVTHERVMTCASCGARETDEQRTAREEAEAEAAKADVQPAEARRRKTP